MEFKGLAEYNPKDIEDAVQSYESQVSSREILIESRIKLAEDSWKPSWWDKRVFGIVNLRQKYKHWKRGGSFRWSSYEGYLITRGYLQFTEEEKEYIQKLSPYRKDTEHFNLWYDSETYDQLKCLSKGEKCYLTPRQCAFVDRYKTKEE